MSKVHRGKNCEECPFSNSEESCGVALCAYKVPEPTPEERERWKLQFLEEEKTLCQVEGKGE